MQTTSQNVELINRILANQEGYSYEQISQAARDYGDACDKLNDLLSQLIVFYRQGFYDEVARLSEENQFLDEYQTLVFQGAEDWRAMCRDLGCEIKASVSVINGCEIQAFLMKYDTSHDLFDRNRLLAYSDAPAETRLDVLYQLSAAFPENPGWIRSIQKLERRRELEIEKFLGNVKRERASYSKVVAMLDELESPVRRTKASDALVQRLRRIAAVLTDDALFDDFHDTVVDWGASYQAQEEIECVDYLKQYRNFSEKWESKIDSFFGKLSSSEQILLNDALKYSETIERREQLQDELRKREFELEQLLLREGDERSVEAALSRAIQASEQAGNTVPPQIVPRAEYYLDTLRMKKRRRTTMQIAAVTVVIAAFIGAVLMATYKSMLSKKADSFATELAATLDKFESGDTSALARAEKQIGRMHATNASLESDPKVEAQVDRFTQLQADEKARLASFTTLVSTIEGEHALGKPAAAQVESVKKLARSDSEKQTANDLYRKDNEIQRDSKSNAEANFAQELDRIKSEFKALQNAGGSDADSALKANQLLKNLDDLARVGQNSHVSEALESSRKTLANSVSAYARNMASASSVDLLTTAIGSKGAYADAVGRAALKIDDAAQSKRVVAALKFVDYTETWNEFVDKYGATLKASGAPSDDAKQFVDDHAEELAFAPEYAQVKAFVDSEDAGAQTVSTATLIANLLKEFEAYKEPCWSLYHEDNGRYYYLQEEVKYGDEKVVKYRPSLSGDPRNFNTDFMEENDVVAQAWPYRVYSLLESMAKDPKVTRKDWLDFVKNITSTILNVRDEELDPVLKGVLLYKLLNGFDQDPALSDLHDWLAAFDAEKGFDPNVDFYKQGTEFDDLRTLVKTITKDMTADALDDKLASAQGGSETPELTLPKYEWVGFIDEENGLPTVVFKKDVKLGSAELYIGRSENGSDSFTQCGATNGGLPFVDEKLCGEERWTPVYARIEK